MICLPYGTLKWHLWTSWKAARGGVVDVEKRRKTLDDLVLLALADGPEMLEDIYLEVCYECEEVPESKTWIYRSKDPIHGYRLSEVAESIISLCERGLISYRRVVGWSEQCGLAAKDFFLTEEGYRYLRSRGQVT